MLVLLLGSVFVSCGPQPDSTNSVNTTLAAELAPALPETLPPAPRELSLFVVGDIMLDRSVGRKIKANGCGSIIEVLAPELQRADLAFGNLECPLSTVGPHDPHNCCFRADPATVEVLTRGGFDIVSLANNHTLDAGRAGLLQTLDHLEEAGIIYCGAAREPSQACWPRMLRRNGLKVGFMAFTDLDFAHGSYSKVPSDLSRHQELIAGVKNKCDLLLVSYHWGQEYRESPTDRQRAVAHAAVEAGADVVLGHHPHTLEGIEVYQGGLILYSMGNFIFDQRAGMRMESALFKLFYTEGEGWLIKVVPVWIPRSRLGPEYPSWERRSRILRRFAGYCEDLGTPTRTVNGVIWIEVPAAVAASAAATAAQKQR